MFTGLIEAVGQVLRIERKDQFSRFLIKIPDSFLEINIGDSLAINGVCLTIVEKLKEGVLLEAGPETLKTSTLKSFQSGTKVNLERPLRLSDRLHGHLVMGHVDGVGELVSQVRRDTFFDFEIRVPHELKKYLVPKGSVALNGISLTVAELTLAGFRVAVIAQTMKETTLAEIRIGERVNLEMDILGKYVARLLNK